MDQEWNSLKGNFQVKQSKIAVVANISVCVCVYVCVCVIFGSNLRCYREVIVVQSYLRKLSLLLHIW